MCTSTNASVCVCVCGPIIRGSGFRHSGVQMCVIDLMGRTPLLFSGDDDDDDEDDLDGPTGKRAADDDDDDEEVRTSTKASLNQWHLRSI